MICFILYDISNNKIRTHIAKYLEEKGCFRVQKSVFMAQLNRKLYLDIVSSITAIQEGYDNSDSVFFVPVSEDEIRGMKIIGKNLNFDLILRRKHTLVF